MMSLKIKKLSATCCILALLATTPFPTRVWANTQGQPQASDQVPGGQLWGAIMGISTDITQQMMAQRQQQQQMIQMQQMMANLAPQNIPAKFFPQCQIPQTIPNTPVGVCEPPAGQIDPGTFNLMNNMAELGSNYVRYYDQMLTPAQNSRTPSGLRCLEDAKTSVISSMFDRQNALQVLIDRINKETQLTRDKNDKFLQEMDDINAELNGGQTGTNENKTLSFADDFSKECQKIIGTEQLSPSQARSSGLLGIVENLRPKQDSASDYISNEVNLKKSFTELKSKLANDIVEGGVSGVLAELNNGGYEVRGFQDGPNEALLFNLNDTIAKKADIIQRKRDVIQTELKKILGNNFTLPETTRNFTEDFDRFVQKADTFYKKKLISDCVTGADSSDLSLNMNQLLRSLEQRSTNSSGVAHKNYRVALQNILDQESHIQDKLAQIRALDRRFSNEITVRYRTGAGRTANPTPYEIFQEAIAACDDELKQDKTFSADGERLSGAGSQEADIERAKELMQEYKEDVQNFETKIVEEVDTRINSCEGRSVTADSCTKDGIFNMNSPNFCFDNASQCSRRIQSCNERAKQLVEERKAKLKVAATQFNQNVQQLVTRQEQILNDVRNQVLADSEFLKNYFPGADYAYPEDLFVKMPELELRNGEMIYGGGDINFKDLADNVGKLKQELANQSDKIDRVLGEYIDDQRGQIEENKRTWSNIAQECRGAARALAQAKATQDNERLEEQKETQAELGSFCQKFNSLASSENPAAGCSGPYSPESLYEDVTKVSAYLDNRVSGALGDYMALCNQSQNEKDLGDEESEDKITLAEACEEGAYSREKKIISKQVSNIPKDLESHKKKIEDYLLGDIDESDLPKTVKKYNDGDYVDELSQIKGSSKFNMSEAKEQFKAYLEEKNIRENIRDSLLSELEERVSDDNDRYCATQALDAAKGALIEAKLHLAEPDEKERKLVTDFSDSFKEQLEKKNKEYQRASRSIASSNLEFDQRWSDIGEGIGQNCAATANTSRGGFLGEMMSPDMGVGEDVLRNLGIQR